jgi:uncharacterized repeat protein (TIGR03803 family)
VFRISPSGSYTSLYSFVGFPTDGGNPFAGLVQGTDANFYGTTEYGGTHNSGTVFRISPSGSYTSLYSFVGFPTDGGNPFAGLVQGSDGNFYGTTPAGGTFQVGTVFRFGPSGSYSNLYSFKGYPNDGDEPKGGLVQGSDGNFYGTTEYGGTNYPSSGTVFRISPGGSYKLLYSFLGYPTDGANPTAGLVQGSDGNFYGTASYGGASGAVGGTVFRISPNGNYTNLYTLGVHYNDGDYPEAGLVQGSDGNFYGTTFAGGSNLCSCGTVFRISSSGSLAYLYSFATSTDGGEPGAGLIQGNDGNFYGTTESGGTSGAGTVFRFSVPLSPPPYPINQITGIQKSGTNVVFSVVSIAGETYQLQFSSSMNPTNWSSVPGVSVTNSIGSILTLTNFAGASQPQGFYRFDITP